ncbi:UDP-glycosyltransferase 89B2 [Linum perenne]
MSSATVAGTHVLVYPYPAAGHIIPILDLTHHLLTRGLTVTILITPSNLNLLHNFRRSHPDSAAAAQLNELIVPAPDPSPPGPAGPTRPIGPIVNMKYFRTHHYPLLVEWFKYNLSPNPPSAIIADFFLGWTNQLASELGIRHVHFSPSGALSISVATSLWRDEPPNHDIVTFPNIPNCPTYPWRQISFVYRLLAKEDPDRVIFRDSYLANSASWGTVINTFARIEQPYLGHLKRESSHNRVWAVGPLLPPTSGRRSGGDRGGASSIPSDKVLTWLDSRPDRSVVYVCFGSRASLTAEQLKPLAAALAKTGGVSFVWCYRESANGGGGALLPEDFDIRVEGRGMVIRGWAPQVEILRHKAVGAFLTHCGWQWRSQDPSRPWARYIKYIGRIYFCTEKYMYFSYSGPGDPGPGPGVDSPWLRHGWNSTVEGITAGVVMLTWPMGADQFTNEQLIVDQLRVGVRVGEGTDVVPDAEELGRILKEAVKEGGMSSERERAEELKAAARDAVVEGGCSFKELDDFVEKLNGKD